MKDMLKEI